jgi:hypothetical protein
MSRRSFLGGAAAAGVSAFIPQYRGTRQRTRYGKSLRHTGTSRHRPRERGAAVATVSVLVGELSDGDRIPALIRSPSLNSRFPEKTLF